MRLRMVIAVVCLPLAGCTSPWQVYDVPRDVPLSAAQLRPPGRFEPAADMLPVTYHQDVESTAPSADVLPEPLMIDPPADPPADDAIQAELQDGLSLERIFELTLQHHPLLRARQHEVEIAEAQRIAACTWTNPQFVLDVDNSNQGPTEIGGRVMLTVLTADKRYYAKRAAEENIYLARMALNRESKTLLTEAADAATEVLHLQQLAELQRSLVKMATGAAEMQRKQVAARAISALEGLEAEADAVDAQSDRLETLNLLEVARLRLARAMGMNNPQPVHVRGRLSSEAIPPLVLRHVLALARQTSPELAESLAQVSAGERQRELAWAEQYPDFEVGPQWSTEFGGGESSVGGRFNGDLPIWDRNQGGVAEAEAQIRLARAMLEVTEANALAAVAQTCVQLLPLQRQLEFFDRHVLPLADRTETIIRRAQQQQAVEIRDLVRAQRSLAQMRKGHLDLLYRFNQLRLNLELALRRPLSELAAETHAGSSHSAPYEQLPDPR